MPLEMKESFEDYVMRSQMRDAALRNLINLNVPMPALKEICDILAEV